MQKARSAREEERPRQIIANPVSAIHQVDITAARSSHPHHTVPQLSVYTYSSAELVAIHKIMLINKGYITNEQATNI